MRANPKSFLEAKNMAVEELPTLEEALEEAGLLQETNEDSINGLCLIPRDCIAELRKIVK